MYQSEADTICSVFICLLGMTNLQLLALCHRSLCSLMLVLCIRTFSQTLHVMDVCALSYQSCAFVSFTNATCHRLLCSLNLVVCIRTDLQMSHVIDSCVSSCWLCLIAFYYKHYTSPACQVWPGWEVFDRQGLLAAKIGNFSSFHSF